jgi:AAA15 family ATPase/GTPase
MGMNDLIPITQLGEGFVRLLRIFSEVLLSESKIILIDEIENGIGYRAQVDLWRGLAANIQEADIQIFATTHSYECIQAAHEVFSASDSYDFALHRLERADNGEIHVVTYNQESLDTSFELNFEVR